MKSLSIGLLFIIASTSAVKVSTAAEPKQVWNYVKVRNDAYMFWWLYYTRAQEGYEKRPLVLWLQGGPGGSSTGFGNFMEIGPLDVNLNERKTTWLNEASLLFVDNPVGAGFSYTTKDSAYTHNSHDIAVDLVTMLKSFMEKVPDFKTIPLYIFSESYGGKMAAAFVEELTNAIQKKKIDCNFRGVALGDSWIAPLNSTLSWAPYLYATDDAELKALSWIFYMKHKTVGQSRITTKSLIDPVGLATVDKTARKCEQAVNDGHWVQATNLWNELEDVIEEVTYGVSWYNILQWGNSSQLSKDSKVRQFERHVKVYESDALSNLMNGKIRSKLKIIPKNVTWGGQSDQVFEHLREDFMKDVISTVSKLLELDVNVVVYSGQLDLIVNTIGTEHWVSSMQWSGLEDYIKSNRTAWYYSGKMAGYKKQYKNFSFYWLLKAGHMVPADQGEAALVMLKDVING